MVVRGGSARHVNVVAFNFSIPEAFSHLAGVPILGLALVSLGSLAASTVSIPGPLLFFFLQQERLEAISKKGFWFKIAADTRFEPEEYYSISRI